MGEFVGVDRRSSTDNGDSKLILYRLDQVEKDVQKFDAKLATMTIDVTTLKSELTHTAEKSAKFSGVISGIATGVIMSIIGAIIQQLIG